MDILKLIAAILALAVALVLVPFLELWTLNTIFHVGAPYTLETWSAMVLLDLFFSPGALSRRRYRWLSRWQR